MHPLSVYTKIHDGLQQKTAKFSYFLLKSCFKIFYVTQWQKMAFVLE